MRTNHPSLESLRPLCLALLALASSSAMGAAEPESAASAVIQTLHASLVAAAASDAPLAERVASLGPVIAATHDLDYIAELSVRRQWRDWSPEQRERFVAAFASLSVTTYASRFDNVGADAFEILDVAETGAGRMLVSASIAAADRDVPLDYTLQDRGQGWRIVNIFADGVSDLALKRAEYQRILADGSLDGLIAHIETQTAALD